MASHLVLITQDEELDLTMDNTDNEQMDKPVLTMATTTQQAVKNFVVEESIPKKKLVQKDLHGFFKITDLHPKKKIITPKKTNKKKKQRSTKTTRYSTEKPKNNMTMTQIYK